MSADFDTGKFVISLDFELFWGVRDKRTIENYRTNLLGVQQAIPSMLALFDKYEVKATFSTVGLLFAKNKEDMLAHCPEVKPNYLDANLSPYNSFSEVGDNEKDDPYHFGYTLLEKIKMNSNHEIGTHTFCHYYCLEPGQTTEEFKQDLLAAKKIAVANNISIRSLVFPRNQFSEEYLSACKEAGIDSYRGNPASWLYTGRNKNNESLMRRAFRLLDTYINLTGYHCHTKGYVLSSSLINVAGSRFLRPYSPKLSFLESLRLQRIKKAMFHAAKTKKLFHLWWHPHNFGVNLQENIHFLEQILRYYQELQLKYKLSSSTMTEIADELINADE
jgi:peptidoglycan/xylan/chitin deacetylase (PgdA/CDA1 family)